MVRKEMIAMLLAGGQGSRLGVLTAKVAKPAVSFGGKYRIIDFPLSNCINSGIDTCWFNPKNKENTGSVIPTYTVNTFSQIIDILKE